MMPLTERIRSEASDSRITRITGIAPATAASKYKSQPLASARAKSASPRSASSALLAVTTCFFAFKAARTNRSATATPPMSSTTMSTSSRVTSSNASSSKAMLGSCARTMSSRAGSLSATAASLMAAPARWPMRSACCNNAVTTPSPMTPQPHNPTRTWRSNPLPPRSGHGSRHDRSVI